MTNLFIRIRNAALSFYLTWLLYAALIGLPVIVLIYVLLLIKAVIEGCVEFAYSAAESWIDNRDRLKAFFLSFLPAGWRSFRDAR